MPVTVVRAVAAQLPAPWSGVRWDYVLFQNDEANAWALPGGKVGIYTGIFTPTEAAAMSAVYAFICAVFIYKDLGMKDVPKEDKAEVGQLLNAARNAITAALEEKQLALQNIADQKALEGIDLTLPARALPNGALHPITQGLVKAVPIFRRMGFALATGPEHGPSEVVNARRGSSPYLAAMANAAASHVAEQDDVHNGSVFHPATVVFSPAVAVAQALGLAHEHGTERAPVPDQKPA